MRSQARDAVYKYLFSTLFNQNDEGLFSVLIKDLSADDKNFAQNLLDAVIKEKDNYLTKISELVSNYKLNRVFPADKCALLLGMAEFDSFPDTPSAVIVDEAVKLVAVYSTEKSTDFVNGVLAEYARR